MSPFDRDTAAAAIAAVLTDAVPAPDRAGPLLSDLLTALLARSPAERPPAEAAHAAPLLANLIDTPRWPG
ncbi:hypothetical protein [Nonomuraea sp. NPDC049709]|uniref:hypothetical protein n=1 Tax=Nonomuraea sp. NPDC049709 TaxID=3154736 RepID=UPI00342EF2FF